VLGSNMTKEPKQGNQNQLRSPMYLIFMNGNSISYFERPKGKKHPDTFFDITMSKTANGLHKTCIMYRLCKI